MKKIILLITVLSLFLFMGITAFGYTVTPQFIGYEKAMANVIYDNVTVIRDYSVSGGDGYTVFNENAFNVSPFVDSDKESFINTSTSVGVATTRLGFSFDGKPLNEGTIYFASLNEAYMTKVNVLMRNGYQSLSTSIDKLNNLPYHMLCHLGARDGGYSCGLSYITGYVTLISDDYSAVTVDLSEIPIENFVISNSGLSSVGTTNQLMTRFDLGTIKKSVYDIGYVASQYVKPMYPDVDFIGYMTDGVNFEVYTNAFAAFERFYVYEEHYSAILDKEVVKKMLSDGFSSPYQGFMPKDHYIIEAIDGAFSSEFLFGITYYQIIVGLISVSLLGFILRLFGGG